MGQGGKQDQLGGFCVIWASDDSLDKKFSSGGGEKCLESGSIIKAEN